jgi:hypothetical protein
VGILLPETEDGTQGLPEKPTPWKLLLQGEKGELGILKPKTREGAKGLPQKPTPVSGSNAPNLRVSIRSTTRRCPSRNPSRNPSARPSRNPSARPFRSQLVINSIPPSLCLLWRGRCQPRFDLRQAREVEQRVRQRCQLVRRQRRQALAHPRRQRPEPAR